MRILSIGDIGVLNGMLHVGDEAMFEAHRDALRERGITDITAVSANPDETAARYGIAAVSQHVVDPDGAAAAVRASDGLVIAGGGNLSSLWPQHIHERLALARLAADRRIPVVISGQTIGPHLTPDDTILVRELLNHAALVGVRESSSFELCREIGVDAHRLTATVDDASFLATEAPPAAEDPYCLVTLASHTGTADRDLVAAGIAALLDTVADSTGLAVRFSAHFVSLTPEPRGDSLMHERVRAHMSSPSSVTEVIDARSSARLARGAALVVSSRYHPAVFAVAGGVPTIGVPVDDYTTVKLRGALGNFGQSSLLSVSALLSGAADEILAQTWAGAEQTRIASAPIIAGRRAESVQWWDRVAATLRS